MNPHPGAVAVLAAAGATQALTGHTGTGVVAGLLVAVGLVWHTTHPTSTATRATTTSTSRDAGTTRTTNTTAVTAAVGVARDAA